MIENLDKLKIAIDVEIKYKYIDIRGKSQRDTKIQENDPSRICKSGR